ncbi:MAG: hypothetical protein AAF550_12625, partial [Myxococcota bacterium]
GIVVGAGLGALFDLLTGGEEEPEPLALPSAADERLGSFDPNPVPVTGPVGRPETPDPGTAPTPEAGGAGALDGSGPVRPGDEGTYGDLKAQKRKHGETEEMDMDHPERVKANETPTG